MKLLTSGMLCLYMSCIGAYAKNYQVKNEQEFTTASQAVKAGDTITINMGTYTGWSVAVSANGLPDKPTIIKSEKPGQAIFSGEVTHPVFTIKGDYVQLQGLHFNNCILNKANGSNGLLIDLNRTRYARITQCLFEKNTAKVQFMPLVTISSKGEYNQVDHCIFDANTDEQDLQVKITPAACPIYTMINDNLFSNKPKVSWKVFNGGECVQIGQDPVLQGTAKAMATVRNNRFIKCDGGGEVISNKSSGNRYISNVFDNCHGELVMRGGHDCVIDSNRITGGESGIRINGSGHTITHSTITGTKTGIRLMYGMAKGKTETGFYIAATGCTVTDNHISDTAIAILVGDNKNQDWTGKFDTQKYPSRVMQDVAPAENKFQNNTFTRTQQNIVYQ